MALPKGYRGWTRQRRSKYWAGKRADKKALTDPTQPLQGGNLLAAARATVDLETQPQITALDTQARSARIQQGALGSRAEGYYRTLAQEAQGDVARVQATRDASSARMAEIGQQGQAAVDNAQVQADVAQARDVDVRGGGLAGGGDERVRSELAAQRARSSHIGQAAQGQNENIGANWEGFTRQMATAQLMRGGEVQERLMNRLSNELSDIRTKKADVKSLAGTKLVDNLTKLRQQAFENAATAEALGQKKLAQQYQQESDQADRALAEARLEETSRNNDATLRLAEDRIDTTRRGQDITRRGQDISSADRAAARRAKARADKRKAAQKAKEKKNTRAMPDQAQKARAMIGNIQSTYESRWQKGKGDSLTVIAKDLRSDIKPPPLLLNIGSALATRGYLTAADVRKLKAAYPGIRIPAGWTRSSSKVKQRPRSSWGPR
jgi:hypothetical protein